MCSYHGLCPKCDEMIYFKDEGSDWAAFLEEEYSRGYQDAEGDRKALAQAEIKVELMASLLAANARVLRTQIVDEFKAEIGKLKAEKEDLNNQLREMDWHSSQEVV